MAVKIAKLQGARRVFLVGSNRSTPRGAYRLEIGHKMGADVILSYEENNVVETILAAVPTGVDRVIVTALPEIKDAIKYPASGIIAFNGTNLEQEQVTLTPKNSTFKKLQYGSHASQPLFSMAIDLLVQTLSTRLC